MTKILIDEDTVKLVLEALETERDNYQDWDKEDGAPEYIYEAITALKVLAEQPAQQEPLFWYKPYSGGLYYGPIHNAQIGDILRGSEEWVPLYTSPPAQRTWVGLTRAECLQIEKDMRKYYDYQHECKTVCLPEFARAIEAKLKEKNT